MAYPRDSTDKGDTAPSRAASVRSSPRALSTRVVIDWNKADPRADTLCFFSGIAARSRNRINTEMVGGVVGMLVNAVSESPETLIALSQVKEADGTCIANC